MKIVSVKVDHVEHVGAGPHLFELQQVENMRVLDAGVESQRRVDDRMQLCRSSRIAAGEQRDLMPLAHQLLGEIGNDSFRAPVQFRWNTFDQWRYLCDSHVATIANRRGPSLPDKVARELWNSGQTMLTRRKDAATDVGP